MTEQPPRQRIRAWPVAVVLFVGGFGSRLVLDVTPGDPFARFGAAACIQILAYGTGLIVLAVWWLRSSDVGPRGMLGCIGWLVLAAASVLAVVTTGYK